MDLPLFAILVLTGATFAGLIGSLTGLGGGAILTPILVLLLGVDMKYAVAASLVAVIATSCGSAPRFLRTGMTNIRVAALLEVATVAGGVGGAVLARYVPSPILQAIFGAVLLWTAWTARKAPPQTVGGGDMKPDPLATRLRLHGEVPEKDGPRPYHVHRIPPALAVMLGAGVLSALIGVGAGVFKVFAMDRLMRMPFKVSTTTSNFMVGVTAAASTGVYLHRGQMEPVLAAPVALGALLGAWSGARLLPRLRTDTLRVAFAVIVALAAIQMVYRGISEVLT